MPQGYFLKVFQITGKVAQQLVVFPDGVVVGYSDNDSGFHRVGLYGNGTFDVRVRVVVFKGEVFVNEVKNRSSFRVDAHAGQRPWFATQLFVDLVQVVQVDVGISQRMDEVSCLEPGYLSRHLQQDGIRGYVERYTNEYVGTTLVKLQAQSTVRHVKLEEGMTGRKVHIGQVCHIPGADNDAPRVRVVLDGLDGLGYLVDAAPIVVGP